MTIAAPMNTPIAAIERSDSRAEPQTPWPEVQPEPSRAPKPTSRPETISADWRAIREAFRWPDEAVRPEARFNIHAATVGKWAKAAPKRVGLRILRDDGDWREWTYEELDRASARLANAFVARGLKRGDRCGLLLPQTQEAMLTHLACYRIGAVVVPLFTLFGEDGLRFRLADSGAGHIVTDAANLPKVLAIRDDLGELQTIWTVDRPAHGAWGFWQELAKGADRFADAETTTEDPAFLSYTSGTTGPPKGALHAHRVLLGHLPGFETHHDFLPQAGDAFWTPADWAWMGGLCDAMLPSLFHGIPVLAHRMPKFDPERAFDLLARHKVRNAFFPPTALKLMRQVDRPRERWDFSLRSVERLRLRPVGPAEQAARRHPLRPAIRGRTGPDARRPLDHHLADLVEGLADQGQARSRPRRHRRPPFDQGPHPLGPGAGLARAAAPQDHPGPPASGRRRLVPRKAPDLEGPAHRRRRPVAQPLDEASPLSLVQRGEPARPGSPVWRRRGPRPRRSAAPAFRCLRQACPRICTAWRWRTGGA